jgi:AraC-like DNA-binding protein
MITKRLEEQIVLLGWVIPVLLGLFLLMIHTPDHPANKYYKSGKNTCAIALLLFGCEIFFQWNMRIMDITNPILSVSAYLFTFFAANLLFAMGYTTMMQPELIDSRQLRIGATSLSIYTILLIINYFFIPIYTWQVKGLAVCCALLFALTCISIYTCCRVYRMAIHDLKRYYSDVVEDMIRWIPGVGVGILIFLISAPFVCWLPRWGGIYQVALGIIMFIYTFICITNFSHHYSTVANAANDQHESAVDGQMNSLSESLKKVLQDKEQRWCERGGYRTPGLTIDQAARDMNTNRSYLSRYLNEVRHMTFYTWIAQMRIQEAQTLLSTDHDASIEQIAMRVGFTTASTFSSTFKKVVGMTPYQWRISRQNG